MQILKRVLHSHRILPFAIVGLLFTTVADAQVPDSIKQNCYANVCLVQCSMGGGASTLGTGVYVGESDGRHIVMTAEHVVRDGGSISCNFQDGEVIRCRVIEMDSTWDIAALELATPTDRPGVEFATANPKRGDRLYAYGFPHGRSDKWLAGDVQAYRAAYPGANRDWIEFQGGAIEGMSGGPVFNTTGQYVGPLWGTDGYTTTCSCPGRLQKFALWLIKPIRTWRRNRLNRILGPNPRGPVTQGPAPNT